MLFNDDIWIYIKLYLFDSKDIQKRIRHNKDKIQKQLIFKLYDDKYDLYHKIMSEVFKEDFGVQF